MYAQLYMSIHKYALIYTGIRGSTSDTRGVQTPTLDWYIGYTLVYTGINVYIQVYTGLQRNTRVSTKRRVYTCKHVYTQVYS